MGVGLKIRMYCLLGPRGYSMHAFWIKFCPGYQLHISFNLICDTRICNASKRGALWTLGSSLHRGYYRSFYDVLLPTQLTQLPVLFIGIFPSTFPSCNLACIEFAKNNTGSIIVKRTMLQSMAILQKKKQNKIKRNSHAITLSRKHCSFTGGFQGQTT